ncbi:MAG: pacearchaeosortase [Patescibacteria group bacterium]|nr:pacearchaeosortase [Patescibacteria group bacterium]
MEKQSRRILDLFIRYFLLLLAGMGNIYIFYKILTPITIQSVGAIVSLFTRTITAGNLILIKGAIIEIVPACVAGAAFYLMFILIFSTAEVKLKKRLLSLVTAIVILFSLNILRIVFLILIVDKTYFPTTHWILWHFTSTIFVVAIWFFIVKIYKIESIPFYSDIKYIFSLRKSGKKSKRKKKN